MGCQKVEWKKAVQAVLLEEWDEEKQYQCPRGCGSAKIYRQGRSPHEPPVAVGNRLTAVGAGNLGDPCQEANPRLPMVHVVVKMVPDTVSDKLSPLCLSPLQ